MKTSSFFLYEGTGRISIARYAPKHITGHASFPALAPKRWFSDGDKNYTTFRARYYEHILEPLNPQHIWDQCHQLAGDHEPVLLCWEHLRKEGEWCHRRMVAEWLEDALGAHIPEMAIAPRPKKTQDDPLQMSLF